MSQQWPPQSNPPASGDPHALFATNGQDQVPELDATPTAPMGAVTPDSPSASPIGTATPDSPPTSPLPMQQPAWPNLAQPPISPPPLPLTSSAPPRPLATATPPRPVQEAVATGGERRSATPLIIGLIVLLVLGGGAAIFALTSGGLGGTAATTTSPSAFAKFTDADGVYSLKMPTTWLSTGNAALTTFGPAAEPGVRVEIERVEVALNNQQDAVAGAYFDSAASSSSGTVTNKTGPTSVTLAGETWSQYAGDLTTGDTTEHIVLLIAGHTTNTVILATLAPKSTFANDDTQFFQPMLKSFVFLK